MENLTLEEVVKATGGKVYLEGKNHIYNKIGTDTRKIEKGSIFIALKGENFNGNNFITEAVQKGAALCLIDEICFDKKDIVSGSVVVKVEDTRKALLDLAEYYKSKLNIKVIGVTGSTGKTSTKDLIAAMLSSKYKVFKTQGNFNNDIGLPLMIFSLDESYDIAVLEMGMSNFGEIHKLAKVARPEMAVMTNIGISHIENLKTRENILKSKLEITDFFGEDNILIINNENDILENLQEQSFKVIRTGLKKGNNFRAENIILNENGSEFDVYIDDKLCFRKFKLEAPGKHNILNALLAMACGDELGVSLEEMQKGMNNFKSTSMRLDILRGKKFTIINDCYNASPDSMQAAIDVMCNLKSIKRKIAVLGTMKELGEKAYDAHKETAIYAKKKGINTLVVLGEFSDAFREGFNDDNCKAFSDVNSCIEFLNSYLDIGDAVLVKASRAMKFENIVKELQNLNS